MIGISLPLTQKPLPEILPPILFNSNTLLMDWDTGTIAALGRSFGDVRLCVAALPDVRSSPPEVIIQPAAKGRRRLDRELEESFVALLALDADFADRAQEKQILAIQTRAAESHSGLFSQNGPGRSTVARFLKRRRETIP